MIRPIHLAISLNKCDSGGQKSLIFAYLRHLDPKRFRFDLIVDSDSNSIPYDEVKMLDGTLHVIPPYQKILAHMKTLRRLFKENNYDILYAINNTMNIFPLYVAYRYGVKVRISESLTMASRLELKKTLMKNVLRCFSHFFCNYFMANGRECGIYQFGQHAMDRGKISIFLTPVDGKTNTFNPKLRDETRKKFGWENNIVYGFIARFEKQKNPMFLLDIMHAIMQKQDQSHFVIIGAGSMEQEMLNKINSLDMTERFSWLGRREDIKQFYNAFDAFLLPSLYEGLPVVGIESQASGLPVFFSDEVTAEAGIAELGHFISLENNADYWADYIIKETCMAMPNRRGREKDLQMAGFDAEGETKRLMSFFEKAFEEQNK